MSNNGQNDNQQQPNIDGRNILSQLFSRLDELSNAISPQPVGDQVAVESEVRRTFRSTTGQESTTNHSGVPNRPLATINSPCERPTSRYRPYSVRQYFPGQRPSQSSRRQEKRKKNAGENKPFMRDLVLLSGPGDNSVPRQGTRLALNQRGHIISGCRFTKSQSTIEVEQTITEAFDGKIPPGVDIELLVSMHSSLVVPSLAPGHSGIDRTMLQRLYRSKPVYIRPNQQLLDTRSLEIVQQVLLGISQCSVKHK